MPIALPPPLPPQQAEVRVIEAGAPSLADFTHGGYSLHIHGDPVLKALPVAAIVEGSGSLSDAIYRLGAGAYLSGYPAAQALYAARGQDIYVLLRLGHVTRVEGEPRLAAFFRNTVADAPLTIDALEADRTRALPHAARLGLDASLVLEPERGGGCVLQVETRPTAGVAALRFDGGNAGNRFVGRYLAGLSAVLADPFGDQFDVGFRRGVTWFNDKGVQYSDQSMVAARATPLGAWGLSAQHLDFSQSAGGVGTSNSLWQYGANWQYPLHADFRERQTLQLGVDRVERESHDATGGALLLEEAYTSAQLALGYAQAIYAAADRQYSFDASLTLRKGLGSDQPARSLADLSYWLWRPSVGAGYRSAGPLRLRLAANAQFGNSRVPEEQQWVLGGADNLTAFVPGVAVGDHGFGARLAGEWRRAAGFTTPTPRLFLEYGYAAQRADGPVPAAPAASAADAGAALDFVQGSRCRVSFNYAWPFADQGLTASTRADSMARLLFSLQLKLTFYPEREPNSLCGVAEPQEN